MWDSHKRFEINSYGKYEWPLLGSGHCMSLPDCCRHMYLNYKFYFPELSPRAFCCGRYAARTSDRNPLRLWEGHRVWEQIPLLWDGTRELCRMKDNQSQECLVFTNCWRKTHGEHSCTSRGRQLTPVLEDSTVRETQLGKLEPALNCSRGRWTGGLTGTEGGGPRPSAPARPKARGNLMCN